MSLGVDRSREWQPRKEKEGPERGVWQTQEGLYFHCRDTFLVTENVPLKFNVKAMMTCARPIAEPRLLNLTSIQSLVFQPKLKFTHFEL